MELPLHQVDAFTSRVFGGNPAAVVPLSEWLEDDTLQRIARENNLSETAFVRREGAGYRIRWFTPTVEVELCGHATLAAAHVLFELHSDTEQAIHFASRSGELVVQRDGDLLELDFPADPPKRLEANTVVAHDLASALGGLPMRMFEGRYHLAVFESAEQIAELTPNLAALATIPHYAIVCSAPGADCDFVSRFFGPRVGVDEDPVTGSAHCMLVPYWSEELGKTQLHARQISQRGGELFCEARGDRVSIAGHAVKYLTGTIHV